MTTYLMLNLVFIVVVVILLRAIGALHWDKSMLATIGVLLVTTAVFDSLIITADIVAYDPNKILGVKIGYAPIEDFAYAILALMIIPNIWKGLKFQNVKKS